MSFVAGDKPHVKNSEGISDPGNTETRERSTDHPEQGQCTSQCRRSVKKYVALDLPRVVEAEGCYNFSSNARDNYLGERFLSRGRERLGKIVLGQLWSELPRTVEAIEQNCYCWKVSPSAVSMLYARERSLNGDGISSHTRNRPR